jgi:hypothetical protein
LRFVTSPNLKNPVRKITFAEKGDGVKQDTPGPKNISIYLVRESSTDPLQGVGSVGLVCEIKPGYEVFAVSKYHGPLKASCAGLVRYLATIRTWNLVHRRVKSVQGQVFNLAEQVVQGIFRHANVYAVVTIFRTAYQ